MNFGFGNVISIEDPIPEAQRVKVRIESIYDDIPDDDLPWCPVARACDLGVTFNVGTSTHQLVPGSRVFCIFLDEYYQQPMVLCQVPRIIDTDSNTSIYQRTISTKGGNVITIDDSENPYIEVKDAAGNDVLLNGDGIFINSSDKNTRKLNIEVNSTKDLTITSRGNTTVHTGLNSDVKIDGNSKVNITGNSNVSVMGNTDVSVTGNTSLSSTGSISIKGSSTTDLNSSGQITIKTDADMNITTSGNTSLTASGNVDIKSNGNVSVTANQVDASTSKQVILPSSAVNMFTCGPIDTFTGQPNSKIA